MHIITKVVDRGTAGASGSLTLLGYIERLAKHITFAFDKVFRFKDQQNQLASRQDLLVLGTDIKHV